MNSNSEHASAVLLNEHQTAEFLTVKVSALRAWRLRGGGPRYVKLGKIVRYRRADLDLWLESRAVSNTSQSLG